MFTSLYNLYNLQAAQGDPFIQNTSIYIVTSLNRSACYQPGRKLLGKIRTRRERNHSTAHDIAWFLSVVKVDQEPNYSLFLQATGRFPGQNQANVFLKTKSEMDPLGTCDLGNLVLQSKAYILGREETVWFSVSFDC